MCGFQSIKFTILPQEVFPGKNFPGFVQLFYLYEMAPLELLKQVEPLELLESFEPLEPVEPVEPLEPSKPLEPLKPLKLAYNFDWLLSGVKFLILNIFASCMLMNHAWIVDCWQQLA